MENLKEHALEITKMAGSYLCDNFKKDASLFSQRGLSKEVTTSYDKECDRIIKENIVRCFPDHSMLTEESGEEDKGSDYRWIVDSLDGSGNFAAGNPFFSVSIALMHKDELILGVIYAPLLDELYVAEKGKGAYLNGERIRVSKFKNLENSYIVACEGGSKTNERMSELFAAVYPSVKDMRKLGSAAIECGYVASGRAEAYATLSIYPWDIAAGILLVQEAGGQVTDFKGKEWRPEQADVLCTNGNLHDTMLKRLKDV